MIDRVAVLCSLLALPGLAIAAPRLAWELPSLELEYGRPITARIVAEDIAGSLSAYRPSGLEQAFVVDDVHLVDEPQSSRQVLALRLYVRAPGQAELPSLELDGVRGSGRMLNVGPAVDRKTQRPLEVSFGTLPEQVWLRQAVHVQATVRGADGPLLLEATSTERPGWAVHVMVSSNEQDTSRREASVAQRAGWVVFPLQSGQRDLQLPPIELVRDGVTTHRFYPPRLDLRVMSLPAYLPASIPVGVVQLTVPALEPHWLRSDTLHTLALQLDASDVLPGTLPGIGGQLRSDDSVLFYPPSVSLQTRTTAAGVVQRLALVLPFRRLASGWQRDYSVTVHYFDPTAGKLVSTRHRVSLPSAIAGVWLWPIGVGLGVATLLALSWCARRVAGAVRRWRRYSEALRALGSARSVQGLRLAMQGVCAAEGWPENSTIAAWLNRWSERYGADEPARDAVDELQRALYRGEGEPRVDATRRVLSDCVRRAHPFIDLVGRLFAVRTGEGHSAG